MQLKKFLRLAASIILCQGAGFVGSLFTRQSVSTWYAEIRKPFCTPPSWVFAPAWTILFILMGVSLWLVWEKGLEGRKNKKALVLFFIQLALNIAWSWLFFGLRSPLYALIEITVLWGAIMVTMISFYKISKKAACLLLPYLLWTGFALALNLSIYLLNA